MSGIDERVVVRGVLRRFGHGCQEERISTAFAIAAPLLLKHFSILFTVASLPMDGLRAHDGTVAVLVTTLL